MTDANEIMKVDSVEKLPPRSADAHKGDFGRVMVVGGSRGMIGAPALAANAALRSGAGLVTVAASENVQLAIAGLCPCATSVALAVGADGLLASESEQQLSHAAGLADVLAIGPGWGVGSAQKSLLCWALDQERPTVIDADGLNNLNALLGWDSVRKCPLVLTPHPGELARLTGRSVEEIQANRVDAAVQAVLKFAGPPRQGAQPIVCVLKGAGTVVTDGRRVYVNDTGNPGMATGGTGDVLTGIIAALLGQKMLCFEAACLGVRIHGRAGDLAAEKLGQVSMTAQDVLESLPAAFGEMA